ncbi:MAG: hypothetical protein HY951_19430 [Bacteroidia bacterium]|nr:hypothetical protein [Bacteroidia bacterium]
MYEVRLCKLEEIDKLQDFINESWKQNHILVKNANLLKWQYLNRSKGIFNFIVAYNTVTNKFDAILGFIPTWHFDPELSMERDIWLAIWKVEQKSTLKKGIGKGIGLDLLNYLEDIYQPNSIGAIGTSEIANRIYRYLEFKSGTLNHYYLLNTSVSSFEIICVKDKMTRSGEEKADASVSVKEINDIRNVGNMPCSISPKKSLIYLYNRFCNHPVYKYRFFGIYLSENLVSIIVMRKITIKESCCLRIVDIYGELVSHPLTSELRKLLTKENAEYLDCLNSGIDETIFYSWGFSKRNNEVVIPNYFEPFEKQNVDITFAYKTNRENYIIFKGDSDQDRPNI